ASAMSRNPDERPQTMESLEYELNKCLAGRGVAVAQILGMTTDPHVVATLNSGLSMRQFDDAVVVSRAQTASPPVGLTRPGSHSGMSELPGRWSGPAMSTGQNPLMSTRENALMARASADSAAGSYPGPTIPTRASSPLLNAPAASDPSIALP